MRITDFPVACYQWAVTCFGRAVADDKKERTARFLEEALKLAQAIGTTKDEAIQLVNYIYGRPAGQHWQETGGVLVTLAVLCQACDIDMLEAWRKELEAINEPDRMERIRRKHAAKPKFSPLPGPSEPVTEWSLIQKLRHDEGSSVTILCDNAGFNDLPNCAIEVSADWTGWSTRRFTGDTVLAALRAAADEMTKKGAST